MVEDRLQPFSPIDESQWPAGARHFRDVVFEIVRQRLGGDSQAGENRLYGGATFVARYFAGFVSLRIRQPHEPERTTAIPVRAVSHDDPADAARMLLDLYERTRPSLLVNREALAYLAFAAIVIAMLPLLHLAAGASRAVLQVGIL